MRQRLRDAGTEFWTGSHGDPPIEPQAGLSIFAFDGDKDGEDIKTDFKTRLATVEEIFTDVEKSDVVEEARCLFQTCIEAVHELDDMTRGLAQPKTAAIGNEAGEPKGQKAPAGTHLSTMSKVAILVACVAWLVLRRFGAF